MTAWTWIAVALLGGFGALARFVLDSLVSARAWLDFPLGTLTINLTGAFVLGFLTGVGLGGQALLLAGTATVGAYTTFSTWMLETHRLAEDREVAAAAVNLVLSIVAGVLVAELGRLIGGQL
jgi:CrcB protein